MKHETYAGRSWTCPTGVRETQRRPSFFINAGMSRLAEVSEFGFAL